MQCHEVRFYSGLRLFQEKDSRLRINHGARTNENVDRIVHKEFVPYGQMVNQHFYLNILEKLIKSHSCETEHEEQLDVISR